MRFSVTFGAVGAGRDPRGLAELARMAEDCGWDGVFLEDYLVYQGDAAQPTYDPWICLAAMACATSTIRLGTTVTPVPRRHPWQLDESLEIITALWTGEPVRYAGKHYQLDGAQLTAVPLQRPRIPIWVGGNFLVPAVRRRILRWDGSCAYKGTTTAPQQTTPQDVRQLLAERGQADGFEVKVKISDGDPRAFADAGATWQGRWIAPGPVSEARQILRAGPPQLR